MTRIGHKIRQQRRLRDLTQAQVGDMLGVSAQQVYKYESGRNTITADKLQTLADAWGIPVGEFYDD